MSTVTHPYLSASTRPRIFAHRGFVPPEHAAHGIAENTLAAFTEAVRTGIEYLETDCHLTSDGRVVLFHDADLSRVAGDPRPIASATHAELAQIMRDRGGLLTLDEMLEAFPTARINIDFKAGEAAESVGRIIAPHSHRVLIAGFNDDYRLQAIRSATAHGQQRPATGPGRNALARLLLAMASRSPRRISAALAGFDALQIPERHGLVRVLSPRLIELAHEHGVEVHVWTVNDPERMSELIRMGVDGIVTDRSDLARTALRG